MRIRFTKMSGAGNDFVVIDNRRGGIRNRPRTARLLCDRRWGVGADGMLLLEKSRKASYKMMYYNADGSYGGMCGNGGRCIARYAVDHRIASREHEFEALGHIYAAIVSKGGITLTMKDPWDMRRGIKITLKSGLLKVDYVNTGAPHAVIAISNLRSPGNLLKNVPVVELGREIRYHKDFAPQGTNVNFIQRAGHKSISMRTYERGVEDETLACGTGSIASAIIASMKWGIASPVTIQAHSGSILKVAFRRNGEIFENIKLSGPAISVFESEITLK